jgi:hypothetical protein
MKPRPSTPSSASAVTPAKARVDAYNWKTLADELDHYVCAVLSKLLSREECRTIAELFPDESIGIQFRAARGQHERLDPA